MPCWGRAGPEGRKAQVVPTSRAGTFVRSGSHLEGILWHPLAEVLLQQGRPASRHLPFCQASCGRACTLVRPPDAFRAAPVCQAAGVGDTEVQLP